MQTLLLLLVVSGLLVLHTTKGQVEQKMRCSYAGVIHLEGGSRYTLNFHQAEQLCQSLDYSLATEEQINKAFNAGLKTCRYGWIEGQIISFLPHIVDPNCTFNSTEVIFQAEAAHNLFDVYCFTQSESLGLNCENALTSAPASMSSPTQSHLTTIANPDQEEDVLEEVIADGFIVNIKGTTSAVKNIKTSGNNDKTNTSPKSKDSEGTQTTVTPQEGGTTTVNEPKSPDMTTRDPEFAREPPTSLPDNENTENSSSVLPHQETTMFLRENTEGNSTQTSYPELGGTEINLTTEETISENVEGSGMLPDTFHKKEYKDFRLLTSASTQVSSLSSTTLWSRPQLGEEGSGIESETDVTSEVPTSTGSTIETIVELDVPNVSGPETKAEGPKGRSFPKQIEVYPTSSPQAAEGTPGWLIIFAFCMTLGAILCVLAGIATKDMWYKPSKKSLNITPKVDVEEYNKSTTLTLSEKEQELVTLMKGTDVLKSDKDFTSISLDPSEKEYLM
ncbi:CD44 antigen-like isoform X1 [Hoplias malabaricus]|uniref:CD44 antigen-like isoform X1 n=1 Tax=Hoplias malabaricus TaxID=27720 RepID=UPI00346220CA